MTVGLRAGALLAALVLLVSGCGGSSTDSSAPGRPADAGGSRSAQPTPQGSEESPGEELTAPAVHTPLGPGERRQVLRLARPYRPSAPHGVGTDDYHCFLLDPHVARDTNITGYDIRPGNRAVVHHVILFRVPPGQVARAQRKDAQTPGDGWTCFGTSGIDDTDPTLDDAPWLGAWAPGGGERVYGAGLGTPLTAGSRIIVQIHYNLLAGHQPDRSSVVLRETRPGVRVTPLRTMLFPAPVELPCRPGHRSSPLCDRARAVADGKRRFGAAGALPDLLHLLCGPVRPGPVQRCDRPISRDVTVRAAAGHEHLLGTSIRIEANPGTPRARTLLDIPVWDFDNQGSKPVRPVRLHAGDTVRVTCHHAQFLRDQQPSFEEQRQDRYVVWGEGSTDEMCLGLLLVTDG